MWTTFATPIFLSSLVFLVHSNPTDWSSHTECNLEVLNLCLMYIYLLVLGDECLRLSHNLVGYKRLAEQNI